ncbi:MAG: hypothetical protein ABSH44_17955 [Bryobacteraceae bacterium]|jgi:hypothetical protein
MRYWAWLAAKLVSAAAVLCGLLAGIIAIFPAEPDPPPLAPLRDGAQILLFNLAVLGWFLLCTGALYIIVWDQRHRCRICLHRLRMPVETGSWGRMLQFGRPRIEYICPYGHGTLKQDELQISGLENPEWTPHSDDIWDELCAASKESDKQP